MHWYKTSAIFLLSGLLACLTACRAGDDASSSASSSQITAAPSSASISTTASSTTASPPSTSATRSISTRIPTSATSSITAAVPFSPLADAIQFYGRYARTKEGGWSFDWPGVTMSAGFEGKGIRVTLNNSAKAKDYLACSVDGGPAYKLAVTPGRHQYLLADGLPAAIASPWSSGRRDTAPAC